MANHHVLNHKGVDISQNDTWLALYTDALPDGITLSQISLLELLHKQEKPDVLLPLSDLLDTKGNIAGGLSQQLRELLAEHASRMGVWVTSDSFVINEHDMQSISDISQAFNALASSYDGRDASALPMFAGA